MTLLLLTELDSGEVLDRAEVVGDEVVYETGHARPIVEGSARRLGVSDAKALSGLRNWTNGYVEFAPGANDSPAGSDGNRDEQILREE